MTPEERARRVIDEKLARAGWIIQDMNAIQSTAGIGVAIREFPTSSGPVDYALFVDQTPVGVIEAKRSEAGESLTSTETQSSRYANSKFLYITGEYEIRFAYEATDKRIRFTDYHDIHYRAREVFSFFQPETLRNLLRSSDTIRNHLKQFTPFDTSGFRKCQINAIENLDRLFAQNKPRMLVQMATGAGKTFTAITESYRLLTIGKMNRILFLVDTKSLGQQAEEEFLKYKPYDDARNFPEIFGVQRLKSNSISSDVQICISTIQRMYMTKEQSFFIQILADHLNGRKTRRVDDLDWGIIHQYALNHQVNGIVYTQAKDSMPPEAQNTFLQETLATIYFESSSL